MKCNKKTLLKDKFFIKLMDKGLLDVTKNGKVTNTKTNKVIGAKCKLGYTHITYQNFKTKYIYRIGVHRLVYLKYVGLIPLGYEINHKDEYTSNNYYKNLEALSVNDHLKFTMRNTNLSLLQTGEDNNSSKLTNKQVLKIRKLARKYTNTYLAKKFKVSGVCIGYIIQRKTYKNI